MVTEAPNRRPPAPQTKRLREVLSALGLIALLTTGVALVRDYAHGGSSTPRPHHTTRRPPRPQRAAVTVGADAPVEAVPSGFVGLSFEYQAIGSYAGTALQPDMVFEQLIANLAPHQRPVLRIGGDSTDHTWWPIPGVTDPGLTYALTPAWAQATARVADDLDARLILGINLEADSPRIAEVEADELLRYIGPAQIDAFEIGNEPNLYSHFPWYTLGGVAVPGRTGSYDLGQYESEVRHIVSVLPAGMPIAGPATGGTEWVNRLGTLLAGVPQISEVTYHRYPTTCWGQPGQSTYASITNLLSRRDSDGLAASVHHYAAEAQAQGRPLRIDEVNTVACGGRNGVSNTFASALWALNTLFAFARQGVAGINVHTFPSAPYALFRFKLVDRAWTATVEPEYYGLLMFEQAAPPGSRLLKVDSTASSAIQVWATRGGAGAPASERRVVLVNDSQTRRSTVTLRVPGTHSGTVSRLQAHDAAADSGVTLGGQRFAPRTTTGVLSGRLKLTQIRLAGDRYVITLPAASAALLTLR